MNSIEEFRHERLRLSGNFMRLLQIQGGTKKDVISLRITQYANHRRPAYAAISYTWGPNPKHLSNTRNKPRHGASIVAITDPYSRLIRVNGRPFRVRINLWNLLYHLRQRGESRFLWVDALCIDQENLEERNFHVQRMSKVYADAVITFVWLGLPSEDRRQARCLEFIAEMARSARRYLQASPNSYHAMASFVEAYLNDRLTQRWLKLLELCKGNYWTRTWIIQEFVEAGKLEVLCGLASLNWEDFEEVVRMIRAIIQESTIMASQPPLPGFVKPFTQTIPFRLTSRRIGHTASTLEDLLSEFYDSRCAERRDKIYGILGIAEDCRGPDDDSDDTPDTSFRGALQPDYSKHILEVYFEVFKYLMQSTQRRKSPMASHVPGSASVEHHTS